MFDELITACKFSSQPRIFIDPKAQCDPDQFDNDPSHPIACYDPNVNVKIASAAGINQVVERLIQTLMNEAQKATRYSSLMSGNNPEQTMTATQAGIQSQQGNATINDKRMDISTAVGECIKYAIGLLMEFWTSAEALRISEADEEFEWVDPRQLKNIPVIVPATRNFIEKWKSIHADAPEEMHPKWMQMHSDNVPATKSVDFDIRVTIGEGLPSNKIALYNIILSLAQLQLIDEVSGQPMPLLGRQQFKHMAEDLLGLSLEDAKAQEMQMQQMQQMQQQQQMQSLNINPNTVGTTANGKNIGGGIGG